MNGVTAIVRKDMTEHLRDKSFFIYGLLTPLVLAFVLNLVFGDLESGTLEVRFGVANEDDHEISEGIASGLAGVDDGDEVQVESLEGENPAAAIDEHNLDAVVTIPAGFGNDVSDPSREAELIITPNLDRGPQSGVVRVIAEGIASDVDRTTLRNVAMGQIAGEPPTNASTDSEIDITEEQTADTALSMSARMMAGMAIMFVFFTVQFGVTSLLEERKAGTLVRLLAAPISRISIVAAKGVVGYLLGVLATMLLLVAATLLMGAAWGSWLGVILLVLAATLTAVAIMAVVAGIAKSTEGASAVQSIIAVGLAMLGGSWFPIPDTGVLGVLTKLTPHYWFLDGLEQLSSADVAAVVPNAAVMVGIALLFGVPATVLLRRKLTP